MTKTTSKDYDQNIGEPRQRKKPGRVPVSCAECRRLKLRCDRKVPCETCIKRGCSAICPEGSLTTGNKVNRLAFADAEELQKKVEQLRGRVSVLEDALCSLQASVSDEPHPLLADGPMNSRSTPIEINVSDPGTAPQLSKEDEELLDAFGTLTLGMRGESRFFGQTARSEYLIHAPLPLDPTFRNFDCAHLRYPNITKEMFDEACKGFDIPCTDPSMKSQVMQRLPTLSQACRLCEIYLEHGEYLWTPIPRAQLFDEILSVIYRSFPFQPGAEDSCLISSHAASLLFMVFTLATLFDPELPAYSIRAKEYFILSRICLRFSPPVTNITLWAIQSLIYQTQFMDISEYEPLHTSSHRAWLQIGFAVKLGHSIGLHVNSSRWQLDEEASDRRARVFWQLFVQDTWISFGFGRPPCIALSYVDCEFPKDPEEHVNAEGKREWGFHPWVWQYTKLLHSISTIAFGAKSPQYSVLLELDRKIRDFPVPWKLRSRCGQGEFETETNPGMLMQRWSVMSCKEATLLNLHRPYFAQALNEMPHDLLRHRYGPSVMAIYRSSWRLIESLKNMNQRGVFAVQRVSLPWSQSLSAAIVMCLLVTRAPTSSLASASLHELDRLCELFEQMADKIKTVENNVEVVQKLRRQAHEAIQKAQCMDKSHPALRELDRISGKTQLVSASMMDNGIPTPGSSTNSAGTPASNAAQTPPSMQLATDPPSFTATPLDIQTPNGLVSSTFIHPTIISDMRVFNAFSEAPSSVNAPDTDMRIPLDFNFDINQPFPLPNEARAAQDFDTLIEISRYFGEDFFGMNTGSTAVPPPISSPSMFVQNPVSSVIPGGSMANGFEIQGMSPSAMPQTSVIPAPPLDSTWQSFVEQLGF